MARARWDTSVNAFEQAAVHVLRRAKRPLTIRELTERMLSDGLITPHGKTPERSLYSIILRSNRRAKEVGEQPTFRVHQGPGRTVRYSLSS